MKLTKEEKAARRAAFRDMSGKEKLDHITTYYKWPILLGLTFLIILGSGIHRQITKKEPVLYVGLANVAVGEELESILTEGFLSFLEADGRRQEVYLYKDLYLSEEADTLNHEYAYASRMKLMGSVNAGRLDAVLMNREAYDLLSHSGYLLELPELLSGTAPELLPGLQPYLTSNEVILSDNKLEYQLGEAPVHEVEAQSIINGMEISNLPVFAHAGFQDSVYLGIIANSRRLSESVQYIFFLSSR